MSHVCVHSPHSSGRIIIICDANYFGCYDLVHNFKNNVYY